MIRKGSRVEHKTSHKVGTVITEPHDTMNGGRAAYVRWDGSTRPANPVNLKNLREARS